VAPDSDESNYLMAYDALLAELAIPEENIHRIMGEADPEEEALRYGEEIREQLNSRDDLPVFDLVMLGLGEDGHTASIFPDRMDLLTSDQVCAVAVHPQTGQQRITLTGRVINNANTIYFLVSGEGKAERISEIMNNDEKAFALPAYHILPVSGTLIWFLDEDASEMI
jgi:6-phosphogluconolactonase